MKPGKRDHKHNILITGAELKELKRHTYMMAESFGLDNRIERYKGKRPIGLYRWDLECLKGFGELRCCLRFSHTGVRNPYRNLRHPAPQAHLRRVADAGGGEIHRGNNLMATG